MKLLAWDENNFPSMMHAIRSAVASTLSVMIARLVQMTEAYWAAIAKWLRDLAIADHFPSLIHSYI